jgi:hypothetical protein
MGVNIKCALGAIVPGQSGASPVAKVDNLGRASTHIQINVVSAMILNWVGSPKLVQCRFHRQKGVILRRVLSGRICVDHWVVDGPFCDFARYAWTKHLPSLRPLNLKM